MKEIIKERFPEMKKNQELHEEGTHYTSSNQKYPKLLTILELTAIVSDPQPQIPGANSKNTFLMCLGICWCSPVMLCMSYLGGGRG